MSSWVPCSVTWSSQPMAPSGRPAARPASFIRAAARVMQRAAEGCGLSTTPHRALMLMSSL
ncbi:MAG: hypothetical protein R2708_22785 [Vicinamibacterales bacterium]